MFQQPDLLRVVSPMLLRHLVIGLYSVGTAREQNMCTAASFTGFELRDDYGYVVVLFLRAEALNPIQDCLE